MISLSRGQNSKNLWNHNLENTFPKKLKLPLRIRCFLPAEWCCSLWDIFLRGLGKLKGLANAKINRLPISRVSAPLTWIIYRYTTKHISNIYYQYIHIQRIIMNHTIHYVYKKTPISPVVLGRLSTTKKKPQLSSKRAFPRIIPLEVSIGSSWEVWSWWFSGCQKWGDDMRDYSR